jgi:protein-tyrosine phosphatase
VSTSILFVCTANICRSPTAEWVMRTLLARAGLESEVEVDSAGTHDYQIGMPPSPQARQAAERGGYELGTCFARRIGPADFERFDLILAMDRSNLASLLAIAPTRSREKVGLLLDYAERHRGKEVSDPYGGTERDFAAALEMIEDGCRGLLKSLSA